MVRCPKCGKVGSLHVKKVKGGSGKGYEAYYMAHYQSLPNGKKGIIRWCHIPKSFIEEVLEKFATPRKELESLVKCKDCDRLGKTLYCSYIRGFLLAEEINESITCAGFAQRKESKGKLETEGSKTE